MTLKKINPTQTTSWKALIKHYKEAQHFQLSHLFQSNKQREKDFAIVFEELYFDFSKNLINEETLNLLISFAEEVDLKDAIEKYFSGAPINETEGRSVLHTALRSSTEDPVLMAGKDVKPKIKTALRKIKALSNKVISGKWKGYTGKPITDIVNIGIGGSDLGPSMVIEALQFYRNKMRTHFISNVDGDHLHQVLQKIDPETTLFVIVSKSFTTQETIANANTIRDWFLIKATIFDVAKHFIAVSSNIQAVENFGIDKKNIFPMWDWVGGRFSLWSSAGITISLALGYDHFKALLDGAEKMDTHFRNTEFSKNIPVLTALLGIWYNNFFGSEAEAVLSYSHYLAKFPSYLQQASMESNGKSYDRNGEPVAYQTGGIVWGGVGTNMQHSFMQLLHQGTKLIPVDFIGFSESLFQDKQHHDILMANFHAQIKALAFGRSKEEVHLHLKINGELNQLSKLLPYKVFKGSKPSNTFLLKKMTPSSLGMLIAMYEHKVFTQGILWNIYSFDQFGVELGKEIAKKMLKS